MADDPLLRQPPSVRWIQGSVAWTRRNVGRLAALALLVAGLAWLATGLYTVSNGSSAAIRRCGSLVDDSVGPGLHLALPAGIDRVQPMKTSEVLRLEVGGENGAPIGLVTGDENLIEVALVVQYRIVSLGRYLFGSEDSAALLAESVRAALIDEVARMPVDDVLTSGKARVQNEVRRKAQAMLEAYGSGLSLVAVNLQGVNPPLEAAPAFLQVNDAKAEAARTINEAETKGESSLSLARGEADRLQAEARAWAGSRLQQAQGAGERFEQVLQQARRTPEQTRIDFYLAMLRKVLPRTRVVVLAPGEKPRLDIYLAHPAP